MNSLIMKYGMHGAYRILGYFSLGICAVGTILIKERLPSTHRKNLPIKSPIQLSMLKEANFNIWLVGAVIALMGYTTPLFYLPSTYFHKKKHGSYNTEYYLVEFEF